MGHRELSEQQLTRRAFLEGAVQFGYKTVMVWATCKTAIPILNSVDSVRRTIVDKENAWRKAGLKESEFLEKYEQQLRQVSFGCSFSPEYWEEVSEGTDPREIIPVLNNLSINHVRFGIRWNQVERKRGEVDLSYYGPILHSFIANGISVTLNIGPIKSFRWPEEYPPDYLVSSGNIPQKGARVTSESVLSQEAQDYTNRLCEELKRTLSYRRENSGRYN